MCTTTVILEAYYLRKASHKRPKPAGYWWFTPLILAVWEAEIGRIMIQGQSRQIVHENLSSK
jgi:hypothetical protein